MIRGKSECVAIVRRREHLDQACLITDERAAHFVCMSLETLLLCRERGLSASTPSNYEQIRGHFTIKGQQLARRWVKEVIAEPFALSKEHQMYLVTSFIYFFAMALFALDLIKTVTERHRPRKVYLWRDTERPVLGDMPPGSGEGAIFAQVAATWLAARGISFEFLDRAEGQATDGESDPEQKRSVADRLRSSKSHIPKPFRASLRVAYTLGKSLNSRLKRLLLRTHVAFFHWKRFCFKRPVILFWGSDTDAVYQAELTHQWQKERDWYTVRVESYSPAALAARSRTRGANAPLGLNKNLVLDTFGSARQNGEPPNMDSLHAHSTEWWATACADGGCVGANAALAYQHRAMIRFATSLNNRVQSVARVLRGIRPDCVVFHLDTLVAFAARQVGIPSVAIAHGGIVSPHFASMHGDVNIVAGEIQKEYYDEVGHYSGRLLALGWPHIDLPPLRTTSVTAPTSHVSNSVVPTVTFLADNVDFYYWQRMDFDAYAKACQKLRALAHAHPFRLIVKLHPRYADVSLFQRLFGPDGLHVRLETTPLLAEVLQETDLAVISGDSTAIMEVAGHQVPAVLLFYQYKPDQLDNPYYRSLRVTFPVAGSLQEMEEVVLQLLRSSVDRTELIRRQNDILPKMLKSCGETASRSVGDICQELFRQSFHSKTKGPNYRCTANKAPFHSTEN